MELNELGDAANALTVSNQSSGMLSPLDLLEQIPEEDLWLAGQLSPHTRRAYKLDVAHFIASLGLRNVADLRKVNRAAVVAWASIMKGDGAKPRTVRRRLSALSSLFAHLIEHRAADTNPVRDIKRPKVNRRQGVTRAFSAKEARILLDAADPATTRGLRDRAILSVGLQAGPRRSEIARLLVRDYHVNAGYKSLHLVRKGELDLTLAINPLTAARIDAYLAAAGHGDDRDGPLFRPIANNGMARSLRRHLSPDQIDRILRAYVAKVGLGLGYSAHSMRATFITTALENGADLEDVQRDVGHADPSTTKLYDRRGQNPERSAAFFATY